MKNILTFKENNVIVGEVSPDKKWNAVVANNGMATALLVFKRESMDFSKPYAELLIHDSTVCPLKEYGALIVWDKNSEKVGVINTNKNLYGVIDIAKEKKVSPAIIMGLIIALDSELFFNEIPENVGEPLNEKMKLKLNTDADEPVYSIGFVAPDEEHVAIFADNGERGVIFYHKFINGEMIGPLLHVFSIYYKITPPIQERKQIEIKWTEDGKKIGLLIDNTYYAVVDVVNVNRRMSEMVNPEMHPIKGAKKLFEYKEKDSFIGKGYYLSGRAPSNKMLALFYDDGFYGVLKIYKLEPYGRIVDELVIFPFYNMINPTIDKQNGVKLVWTDDSSRVAFLVDGEYWAIIDLKTKRKLAFDTKDGMVRPINPELWEKGIPKTIGSPIIK